MKKVAAKRPKPKVCLKCYRLNPGTRDTCLGCGSKLKDAPEVDLEDWKSELYRKVEGE